MAEQELRERVARWLYETYAPTMTMNNGASLPDWPEQGDDERDEWRKDADKFLATLALDDVIADAERTRAAMSKHSETGQAIAWMAFGKRCANWLDTLTSPTHERGEDG